MSTKHLLNPELLPLLDAIPPFQFTRDNIERFRSAGLGATSLGDAFASGVFREEVTISGPNWDVSCLIYRPLKQSSKAAYLHIHGGGFFAPADEAATMYV